MDKKIFWLDKTFYKGPIGNKFQGGYYFRAFDLIKFMKLVEKEEGEVVGLPFSSCHLPTAPISWNSFPFGPTTRVSVIA